MFNVYLGLRRGMIAEILTLIGLIAAIFIAIFWYADLSEFLIKQFKWNQTLSNILSFIIIFIAVIMAFRLIEYLISQLTALLLLNWVNNLGGALFGFFRGAIIVGLLLFIINFFPLPLEIKYQIKESTMAEFFLKTLIAIYSSLKEWMPNHFQFDIESLKKIIYTNIN